MARSKAWGAPYSVVVMVAQVGALVALVVWVTVQASAASEALARVQATAAWVAWAFCAASTAATETTALGEEGVRTWAALVKRAQAVSVTQGTGGLRHTNNACKTHTGHSTYLSPRFSQVGIIQMLLHV